jgi:two-component system sensor histidine kinase UhpB
MKPKKPLADLLLVGVVVAAFWGVATVSELFERVAQFSQSYEALQLDELPLTLLVLSLGMAWYGWRRTIEAQAEVAERIRSQQQVQELLQHNSDLLQRLFTAEEDERRALARELHDEMGQTSTAIRTEVAVLQRSGGLNDEAHACAKRIGESAQHLSHMTRQMLQRLRPAALDSMGLAQALSSLCDNWQVSSHITCHLKVQELPGNLNDYASVTLYRIVQEALTNVARHSQATQVNVQVRHSDSDVVLSIQDNGHGMQDTQKMNAGFGLLGMQERVASLAGTLRIESPTGRGLQLLITIPKETA